MKKIIIIILIFIVVLIFNSKNNEEAIRLRVIANSNSTYDQEIKEKVKNTIQKDISYLINKDDSYAEVEKKIVNNLNDLEKNIDKTLKKENYSLGYNINYGYNYFPQKTYNGKTYEEGEYKSLVVSLGEGKGNNWWCILFPPLCLIEAEESSEEVEYDLFFKKIINFFNI